MNSEVKPTLEKPSGTTNFYPYIFNNVRKTRSILFQGGIPLHEIIYVLYDFCLHYINNTSKNEDTYLSIIQRHPTQSRPVTLTVVKLNGLKTKKQRIKKIRELVPELIESFKGSFKYFINDQNLETRTYREDTSFSELKQSKQDFYDIVIPKLKNI